MPLNRDHLGRSTTSSEPFEVTRGDIRRFATAIGDLNPAYHDRAAAEALGHRDLVAPPTFLVTLGFSTAAGLITDPDLGLDYSLVVHGEQRFELHRPVYAGDQLDTESRLDAMRDAGRNELLSIVTEVTAGGERVATTTNTLVSRGTAAARPTTPEKA
jgi:acyl dehydratase